MTDYNNEQCEKIVKGILGYRKEQGAWLGLARFSGHMTYAGQIICMLRDPMDTCIGNYRQLFTINNPYYAYSLDLLDTEKFYSRFYKLMQHFSTLYSNIRLVKYEELVAKPEQQIKELVSFCNLEWQLQCIDFYLSTAPVSTASKMQVRQPLNNKAIGRWKAFKPHTDEIEDYFLKQNISFE